MSSITRTRHCRVRQPTPPIGVSAPWLKHSGASMSTLHRWFRVFNLQPHRHRHFNISNDPHFGDKVQDFGGLYLNPPDHAIVLCVDKKA